MIFIDAHGKLAPSLQNGTPPIGLIAQIQSVEILQPGKKRRASG
jgi:hypothetical protein